MDKVYICEEKLLKNYQITKLYSFSLHQRLIFWVSKHDYLVKLLVSSFIDTTHNNFWKTNPVTETRYQINSESLLTWHQAIKSCQQQDAELLSITDLREEMYLLGKVK